MSSLSVASFEATEPSLPPTKDFESMERAVKDWAFMQGFAVVTGRSDSENGQKCDVEFICDKSGGRSRQKSHGIRSTTTSKTASKCPFRLKVSCKKKTKFLWVVNGKNLHHIGHHRTEDPMEHMAHRVAERKERQADERWAWLEDFLANTSIQIRDILAEVHKKDPSSGLTDRELYNWRARLIRDRRRGLTDIQAFVQAICDAGGESYSYIEWENEEIRRPRHMAWSLSSQLEQWKIRPWVLSLDATYKTNYKHMPLVIVTTTHPEGLVIPIFQAVLADEGDDSYLWLISTMRGFAEEYNIDPPQIIITDGDPQMIKALDAEYPLVQRQRCIFHLAANVVTHLKRDFNIIFDEESLDEVDMEEVLEERAHDATELDRMHQKIRNYEAKSAALGAVPNEVTETRAGFFLLFQHMLYSTTANQFNLAFQRIKVQFCTRKKLVDYIIEIAEFKDQWAGHKIQFYLNFGRRVTSPNESMHAAVKSYRLCAKTGFLELYDTMKKWFENRLLHIRKHAADSKRRIPAECNGHDWCGNTPTNVTRKCLGLLLDQRKRYLASRPSTTMPAGRPLPACTFAFRSSRGLPCAHEMEEAAEEGQAVWLNLDNIHPWYHIPNEAAEVCDLRTLL